MKINPKQKEALRIYTNLKKEQFGEDITENEKQEYLKALKRFDEFNEKFRIK